MLPQVVTYLPGLRPLSTMELYTDTYYIQRIQAGDVACFVCLLDKYSRPINSLILKVVQNQEEAEELAQDTFMKVFKNLASFKGDCSFSTWIYRIAYNTAISSVRKKRYEFLAIEETTLYKRFAWDEDGLPSGAAGVYVSPDVSIDNAANTLRFECESNWTGGSFFVWSEFSLFILSE